MPKIKIRKFEIKDLKKVLKIEQTYFKQPYTEDLLIYYYNLEPEAFLVAESNGEVIGYTLSSFREGGHIISIAVIEKWRRKGIGSKLLFKALEVLKSKGCSLAKAEVRKSNTASQKFFEKHGFEKVGEVKSYYQDGEDAIIYQKGLL